MTRRTFAALPAAAALRAAAPKTILLRSGWQTVNIGDIAHTPGVLRLLAKHIPEAALAVWPGRKLDRGVDAMLTRAFPGLRIVTTADAKDAFADCVLFLHGSSAQAGNAPQIQAWRDSTGRPYGYFGVGYTPAATAVNATPNKADFDNFANARFIFTRETTSLANLKQLHLKGPELAFAPDGTFSFDLRDDAKGDAYLASANLGGAKFIAVIPRLRYTPYHLWEPGRWPEPEKQRRVSTNEQHKEADHAKLREVIVAWVRQTGGKALLRPEMTYELDIIRPLLFDPLPDDIKKNVVVRKDYWLPDEAASVYRKAAAVVSFECHSPIIAAVQGTPCIYVNQPEDGIKGQMWPDLGLGDWFFHVEQTTGAAIAARVLEMGRNPDAARRKVRDAVALAQRLQAERMQSVRAAAQFASPAKKAI